MDDPTDLLADIFWNAILRINDASKTMGVLCWSCCAHTIYSRWMVVVVDVAIEEFRELSNKVFR